MRWIIVLLIAGCGSGSPTTSTPQSVPAATDLGAPADLAGPHAPDAAQAADLAGAPPPGDLAGATAGDLGTPPPAACPTTPTRFAAHAPLSTADHTYLYPF